MLVPIILLGIQDVQSYAVFFHTIFRLPQLLHATRFILGPMASSIGKLVYRCTRISSLPLATGSFENGVASIMTPPSRRLLTMAYMSSESIDHMGYN